MSVILGYPDCKLFYILSPSPACSLSRNKFKKYFFFPTFIYFWDREKQSMNRGGAEREGDTESETGSRL